ncbi:efflux RND transporter periplasmic adaptor subunit [Rhizobium sp. S-51]|uniref:Efflux RND transporter periplasmic adaptor subunit n=1 Tax=Rhizobium terricola TaxID=2728849 RepID=A0A7Y0AYI5_9HYPH|nr:efflux RND transporter periplasmic adaptor subunit [Rhizobium terricola]NML75737.1 efflux RND transporter periplasmic adaptor subunit [Rhizobium terricola]
MNALTLARFAALALCFGATGSLAAETIRLDKVKVLEWKAVYGRVEARDSVAARARIGGTVVDLKVTEGDNVKAGDVIASVKDDKIDFQIAAIEAQLLGLRASLDNAQSELSRGEELIKRGVTTAQRLDALRTQVDVVRNQIAAAEAQRSVVVEQGKEGAVLAPADGKVLTVPVTRDAVIMAGEPVATIGGGGFFLRLAIPERHSDLLRQDATIEIDSGNGHESKGRLAKIYPEIDNGRVIADVEVENLPASFVNKRLLVRVPVGERDALLLPVAALTSRFGVDYVTVKSGDATVERAVVTAKPILRDGKEMTEILTGLSAGDEVVLP